MTKSTLQSLLEVASQIPTGDVKKDSECLRDLLTQNKIYFDFCFSRFQKISDKPEAQFAIKNYIEAEKDPNYYLPMIGILISKLSPNESADFLFKLIQTERGPSLSSYILIQTGTNMFIKELCRNLFNIIPTANLIFIRDDLLFRYRGLGGNNDFIIECIAKIPANSSIEFYQEFLLFFTWLLNDGCKSEALLSLAIDIILTITDPYTLIDLIHGSDLKVPQAFVDWLNQNVENPPEFPQNRIVKQSIEKLPPMLRIQVLRPATSAMNTPRFVRIAKATHSSSQEVKRRSTIESDPKLLHDLAVSSPTMMLLRKEIPMKYTLLALAAIENPNLTDLFLGEFAKIEVGASEDIIAAACHSLELLSERNPGAVAKVLPRIRQYLETTCSGKLSLLSALANSVNGGSLHSGFIWRDYKCVLTATEDEYEEDSLVHKCISNIISGDEEKVIAASEYHLTELFKTNRPLVETAILRIPPNILEKHPHLMKLRPTIFDVADPKSDMLQMKVMTELKKPRSTQSLLLISAALGAFPDAIHEPAKIPDSLHEILRAGHDVYAGKLEKTDLKELDKALESPSDDRRYAATYALVMLIANGLLILSVYTPKLISLTGDKTPIVRMMALFGLSFCKITNPDKIIKRVLTKKESVQDDLIGLGYCITSWTTQLGEYLSSESRKISKIPLLWPHVCEACKFLLMNHNICEGDPAGFAQYIHLTIKEKETDSLVDKLLEIPDKTLAVFTAALLGAIPILPFSRCPLILDERQRKIFEAIPETEEFELLKAIIKHPRLAQPAPKEVKVTTSSLDRIRKEYKTLDASDFSTLLSTLSNSQKTELMNEAGDHSLFVATKLNEKQIVGKLIGQREWDDFSLAAATKSFKDSALDIVSYCLEDCHKVANAAVFLAFVLFGEKISSEKSMSILPWMLSNLPVTVDIIRQLVLSNVKVADISHALILTHPHLFESSPDLFN